MTAPALSPDEHDRVLAFGIHDETVPTTKARKITLRDVDNRDDGGAPYEFTGYARKVIGYLDGPLRGDVHDEDGLDAAIEYVRAEDIDKANALLSRMSIHLRFTDAEPEVGSQS